jgi:hypothetical protein
VFRTTDLWDSAFDFERAVWPRVSRWLPGTHLVTAETRPDVPALMVLDAIAGVDAWVVTDDTLVQGLASRVQYQGAYDSFTIRSRRPSGLPTELDKRLLALRDESQHWVVPHFTVQAYLDHRRIGDLQLVLMVRTESLYFFIEEQPDLVSRRTNPVDGSEFLVVWASDLAEAGYHVMRWVRPLAHVVRNDGPWVWWSASGWIPEDVHEEQTLEDRRVALACAVRACASSVQSQKEVLRVADSFFEWLQDPGTADI